MSRKISWRSRSSIFFFFLLFLSRTRLHGMRSKVSFAVTIISFESIDRIVFHRPPARRSVLLTVVFIFIRIRLVHPLVHPSVRSYRYILFIESQIRTSIYIHTPVIYRIIDDSVYHGSDVDWLYRHLFISLDFILFLFFFIFLSSFPSFFLFFFPSFCYI